VPCALAGKTDSERLAARNESDIDRHPPPPKRPPPDGGLCAVLGQIGAAKVQGPVRQLRADARGQRAADTPKP
jgi:hypothetical protein